MRILIDGTTLKLNKTGIANYLSRIIDQFEVDDFQEIYIISNDKLYYKTNNLRIKFIEFNNYFFRKLKGPLFLNSVFYYYCIKLQPDLVWCPNGFIPLLPLRCKKIVTIHDFTHIFQPNSQYIINRIVRKIFQYLSLIKANLILVDSKSTYNDLLLLYSFVNYKIVKILYPYHGVYNINSHIAKFQNAKPLMKSEYIVTVGTIEPRKNIQSLINGFNMYKDKFKNSELKLVIIGDKGWKTNIDFNFKDIIYTGYISEEYKLNYIRHSIFFIFPSLYEGFGMPIIEAQCLGVPVVNGTHASVNEVANNISISIEMTDHNIFNLLINYNFKNLSLVCRMPSDIISEEFYDNKLFSRYVNSLFE